VFDAREPVLAGDRVLTSAASTDYPAGLPVGEIIQDASPESTSLSTTVRPFVDAEALRFVVVLAWPPDPVTAATDDAVPEDTTSTTLAEETTTTSTTPEGDG
jgi:cell shape-determining protein MreC